MSPPPAAPSAALKRLARLVCLVLVAVVLLAALLRPPRPGRFDPVQRLGADPGPLPAVLSGRLLSDARPVFTAPGAAPDPRCRLLLQTGGGRVELELPHCQPLQEGWRVRASGSLRRPRPAAHPLLAGPAERLARQGVWSRLTVERLEVLERPPTPVLDLRRRIAERFLNAAGPERGGLLAALVLGSAVVPLPAELREAFRASGLSHALAASGFHLTVLLGAVLALSRPLGAAARLGLAAVATLGFLLLAGPQPSVVRAVLMGSAGLIALECGRRTRPLGILVAAVVLMLLLRPDWLRDVGFQLSVAATAGLLVSAGPLERRLAAGLPAGRWGGWLAAGLAVPLAASLWTLPLQLLHFGCLPLYAVPANLAAAPLLTPLTLGAMALALVAALLPALLGALMPPLAWLGQGLLLVAQLFAGLPGAQWRTGRPLPALALLFGLALLALLLPGLGQRLKRLGVCALLAAVLIHVLLLSSDRLLFVHQSGGEGGRELLLARHQGRAALISSHADGLACRQTRQLADGLGVERFDWLLLLDPVASADPSCWQRQGGRVVAYGDGAVPLLAGQQLASRGLAVEALTMDSHALRLRLGRRQWLLLPDRQALWAWQHQGAGAQGGMGGQGGEGGLWLGFQPGAGERQQLNRLTPRPSPVWLAGAWPARRQRPPGWQSSGLSGSLEG